jgi:hypothetical protein
MKPVISFDPDDLSQINQYRPDVSNSAEVVFHELCGRVNFSMVEIKKSIHPLCQTFDSACKAHYEGEFFHSIYPYHSQQIKVFKATKFNVLTLMNSM